MGMRQRFEFFAPIWRVMRDDNMSVDEVEEQIRYVALAVKQGSQVGPVDVYIHLHGTHASLRLRGMACHAQSC